MDKKIEKMQEWERAWVVASEIEDPDEDKIC
jgi:hypothetical protein